MAEVKDDPKVCPQCGGEVVPAEWKVPQSWFGPTPERRPEFRPAHCTKCEWEGSKTSPQQRPEGEGGR